MKNIKKIAFISLIVILCIYLLLITNVINIFGQRNFIHPDDYEYYFFGNTILNQGSITKPINLEIPGYSKNIFCNQDFTLYQNKYCIPTRAIGYDFVMFVSLFSLNNFYFVILSLISILLIIYIFLFSKMILTKNKYALISVCLVAISFPFILWSNINISNIASTLFFVLGAYYLLAEKNNLILPSIFFCASFFIRYEFLIYIVPLILISSLSKKFRGRNNFALNFFISILLILVTISSILIFNNIYYGGPFSFGYLSQGDSGIISEEYPIEKLTIIDQINLVILNRFTQTIKIEEWYFGNINNWVFNVITFPIFLLGFMGIFMYSFKEKKYNYLYFVILLFLLSQIFLQGLHWGYDKGWSGTPYIRYLLPGYIFLIIFSCFTLKRVHFYKKYLLTSIILISLILYTTSLITAPTGLVDSMNFMNKHSEFNKYISGFADNKTVIITNFFDKTLIDTDTTTINLLRFNYTQDDLNNITNYLVNNNYEVYIINAPWHKKSSIKTDQLNLKQSIIKEDEYYTIIRVYK